MSYAPSTIKATAAYWVAQGGKNLGIVGDANHVDKGVSYHLGRDLLKVGAYSIKTARDKAGLTNGASALDLGRLDGSLPALRMFSTWLVDQARKNAPGTSDMREIIYSPDGATVLRWDRERGFASPPKGGEADNTHLTHTHISWYRDAEWRDHTIAFRPYFEEPSDMPDPSQYLPGYTATIKATSNVRATPAVNGTLIRNITSPETWPDILGFVKGGIDTDGGCTTDQWLTRWHDAKWEYTSFCNITAGPTAPVSDCTSQVKAATDPLNAQIAQLQQDITTAAQAEQDRIAAAEAARIEAI